MEKEIINKNPETPLLNEKDGQENNNNERDNLESKEDSTPNKIILKKNVRLLKVPNEENNEKEEIPNIQIEIKNDFNENMSNEIINDINSKEIKNENSSNLNEEKNNELDKNEDKEKGYLDDDLDDEENKKLYLRVVKRMEKTYGVPIIAASIPGQQIEDIEIEEDIRPISINNKKEIKNQQNLQNKKNNVGNINLQQNIINNYNKNLYNNNNTYEYKNNNNIKGINQYIMDPINNNKYTKYQTKKYNNYINNKYPINNNIKQFNYYYPSQKKYDQRGIRQNNRYPFNNYNINTKLTTNKTPIENNNLKMKYLIENPSIQYQRKKNEIQKPINKKNNSRYQSYLNNKNNYTPISKLNYSNFIKTQTLHGHIPTISQERYNNYDLMGKTYNILSNKVISPAKINTNQKNINKNKNNYIIQSLQNYRSPIIPKRSNIPTKYSYNNYLKNPYYYSSSSYIANNQNIKKKNIPKSQNENVSIYKNQQILNLKNNNNIGYIENNNNGRNNKNNSYDPFAQSLNIINYSRKGFNNQGFKSLQNYQINYNYNNCLGKGMSNKKSYVTYCIDSTYY